MLITDKRLEGDAIVNGINDGAVCIFLHMPKTGGSTLQEIIQRQYSAQSTYEIDGSGMAALQRSIDGLRSMNERELNELSCIKGHMPYGAHRFFEKPSVYVTMLRHPYERAVSDYYFARNTANHGLYDHVRGGNLSLEAFLDLRKEQGLANIYCRLLGEAIDWGNVADLPLEVGPEALDLAKRNINDNVAVVGLTELFDASLLIMRNMLNWGDVHYVRRNVTRDKPPSASYTKRELRALFDFTYLDLELYSFARRKLGNLIASAGKDFRNVLAQYQHENACLQKQSAT